MRLRFAGLEQLGACGGGPPTNFRKKVGQRPPEEPSFRKCPKTSSGGRAPNLLAEGGAQNFFRKEDPKLLPEGGPQNFFRKEGTKNFFRNEDPKTSSGTRAQNFFRKTVPKLLPEGGAQNLFRKEDPQTSSGRRSQLPEDPNDFRKGPPFPGRTQLLPQQGPNISGRTQQLPE